MEPLLIYKDRHILVVDKPAKMPSVNVPGGNPKTIVNWIIDNFPKQAKLGAKPNEAGLIYRLDNDTSGIIIAARSNKTYERLRGAWTGKDIIKEYTCLVLGQAPARGRIIKLIAHHPDKSNKMFVVENANEAKNFKARNAETEYETLEYFPDYTLLKVNIKTGIRHQIRCHLASIGHPIAGDKLYQRIKHHSRDWLNLDRHFLHASRIRFTHPSSGKSIEFTSPLPKDLDVATGFSLRRYNAG